MQNNQLEIERLASYIKSLKNFTFFNFAEGNYDHMGATITDAILQAGLKYETVVRPRAEKIKQFLEAKTTSGFFNLIQKEGLSKLINWVNPEKLSRIENIVQFFIKEKIETEIDLKEWLLVEENLVKLKSLRGVGDKTVDYFKILVGFSGSAIDRHLLKFLHHAGIDVRDYNRAKTIIDGAADALSIDRRRFDYSIWKYMSDKKM